MEPTVNAASMSFRIVLLPVGKDGNAPYAGSLEASPGDHAAHLCIHMQCLFAEAGPWPTPWVSRVVPVIQELVA